MRTTASLFSAAILSSAGSLPYLRKRSERRLRCAAGQTWCWNCRPLLSALGTIDYLCFGSEWEDERRLMDIARVLIQEPEGFRPLLLAGLKKGLTWPQARIFALTHLGHLSQAEAEILSLPNHILGIEYCKALLRQNSSILPITILRRGKGYHDQEIDIGPQAEMASATGLRARMKKQQTSSPLCHPLKGQVPPEALRLYQAQHPIFPEDFSMLLNYALLSCSQEGKKFSCYEGIAPDLEKRMEHVLFHWTADDMEAYRLGGYAFYGRILGFKRQAAPLLKAMQKNSSIPLITRTAGYERLLSGPAIQMIRTDFYASHLWHSVYCSKYGASMKNEFNRGMIIL